MHLASADGEVLLHLVSLPLLETLSDLGDGERSNFTRCHPWQDGGGRQASLMRNIRQLATSRGAIISRLAARDKIHGG